MPTLHFGFEETSYSDKSLTAADVAEILEDKYGVVEHFYELHKNEIEELITEAFASELNNSLQNNVSWNTTNASWKGTNIEIMTATKSNPYAIAIDKIKEMFHRAIDQKEFDSLGIPGVPTKDSLKGKTPSTNKGPVRPSFLFSGIFKESFRVWIE